MRTLNYQFTEIDRAYLLLLNKNEMQRFEKRLNDAIGKVKFEKGAYGGSKESGALKKRCYGFESRTS